jgi:hypothetical protein
MVGPERSGVPDSWAEGAIREAAEGVKELRRWFLGNGSEGVAARFARMDERMKAIEAKIDGIERAGGRATEAEWRFWAKIVGVASVAAGMIEGIAILFR